MADQQALHAFSQWVAGCSGDEKQEAQTFVQKLLTAWGWEDASEAGVSFEHRIPKGLAYAYRDYLGGCDANAYLDAEAQAERYRHASGDGVTS